VAVGVVVLVVVLCVVLLRGSSSNDTDPVDNTPGAPLPIQDDNAGNASGIAVTLVPFVTSGLSSPWGFAFLPDNRLLVTEKGGALKLVNSTGSVVRTITGTPTVDSSGQGALMDVALDLKFSTNRLIYLTFAEPGTGADSGKSGTAVLRARLSDAVTTLENATVIFRQIPKRGSGGTHYGSRVVPHPDAEGNTLLYVCMGDRGDGGQAQFVNNHLGKVARIKPDGSSPSDNPDWGNASLSNLWSIGHRNPQAAALHPLTGQLWIAEHGPQGGDEVNVALAGRNFGWETVSYGCAYGSTPGSSCRIGGTLGVHNAPFISPVVYWYPYSVAPGGMLFHNTGPNPSSRAIPEWNGHLFVGGLSGKALYRFELNGTRPQVVSYERLLYNQHEVRELRMGPDGLMYLTSRNTNQIFRVQRV